jgi:hypothetical protein
MGAMGNEKPREIFTSPGVPSHRPVSVDSGAIMSCGYCRTGAQMDN